MSHDARAVVFDLDDTLYPYRWFLRSGFLAVAAHLSAEHGVNDAWAFRRLLRASRGTDRGRELQACLDVLRLSPSLLPGLIRVLRAHDPAIALPRVTVRMLSALRASGWRLGVLTNGEPSVQARKIAALNLTPYVDVIVMAAEYGSGAGKPEPQAFDEIARRLEVAPARTVLVGDDPRADIAGARRAGMHAVLCAAWTPRPEQAVDAGATIDRLSCVPDVARVLLEEAASRHAA